MADKDEKKGPVGKRGDRKADPAGQIGKDSRDPAPTNEPPREEREAYISKDSVKLHVIVVGNSVPVVSAKDEPLSHATTLAIAVSRRARAEPWEVRDEEGNLLDEAKTPSEQGLKHNAEVFVTLPAGADG